VSEFHAEAPQATASEGLGQGPYVAAIAGFQPMILWWIKGDESTIKPACPTTVDLLVSWIQPTELFNSN